MTVQLHRLRKVRAHGSQQRPSWSEPMGRSKGHRSQCKKPHSVKQILDLAHAYSAVTFYLAYWHKGSVFSLFFTRFLFCLPADLQRSAGSLPAWGSQTHGPATLLLHGFEPSGGSRCLACTSSNHNRGRTAKQFRYTFMRVVLLCQGNSRAGSRLALVGTVAVCELGYTAEQVRCAEWVLRWAEEQCHLRPVV